MNKQYPRYTFRIVEFLLKSVRLLGISLEKLVTQTVLEVDSRGSELLSVCFSSDSSPALLAVGWPLVVYGDWRLICAVLSGTLRSPQVPPALDAGAPHR